MVEEPVERHAPFLFFLCVNLCVYYVSYVYFMIFFCLKTLNHIPKAIMLGKHGMSFKPFILLFNRLHLTLHPSSIPWNPLCLSGFQRLMGTIPPFITLHFYKDLSLKTSII